MKATVVDLRYRMNDILKALDRNEDISILYHGKFKGVISGCRPSTQMKVSEHPFFNMSAGRESVKKVMDELRGLRHRAL